MKKTIFKKISAWVMALAMTVTLLPTMAVSAAAIASADLNTDAAYAFVASNGKAIVGTEASWATAVTVKGRYSKSANSVEANGIFKIEAVDGNENAVRIVSESYSKYLRSESGGAADYVFVDGDNRNDDSSLFYINDDGTIQDNYGKYLYIGTDDKLLRTADADQAEKFTLAEDVQALDLTVYIKNVATGKLITFKDQTALAPISVTGDPENITEDEKFVVSSQYDDAPMSGVDPFYVFGLQSVSKPTMSIISARYEGGNIEELVANETAPGGWEAVKIDPNGEGTVCLRSAYSKKLITVNDNDQLAYKAADSSEGTSEYITDREKFIVYAVSGIDAVTGVQVSGYTNDQISLTWDEKVDQIITGYEVWRSTSEDGEFSKIADTVKNSYEDNEVNSDTTYYYKVYAVNGQGNSNAAAVIRGEDSDIVSQKTLVGGRPAAPETVTVTETGDGVAEVSWSKSATEGNISYKVMAAPSAFAEYTEIGTTTELSLTVNYTQDQKWQYYKIITVDNSTDVESFPTDYVSLETEMFGDNITFFAPTDNREDIDKVLAETFEQANDFEADAQFQGEKNSFYYKPGDYTDTKMVSLGFYTQLSGLGITPYEVKLNNIEVPAYLDQDASRTGVNWYDDQTGIARNATCNFWRSAENLSVVGTELQSGDDYYDSRVFYEPGTFAWAVAQAAPLRRIYTTRTTQFDWSWGWASGGFAADCLFAGNQTGTDSGQQFYMRNSEVSGSLKYCTLNTVYQGVLNSALPTTETEGWAALKNGNGYTNWGTPNGTDMQTVTTVNTTPIIREKPFLYLDTKTNEYMVFVPDWQRDTSGVTWSEGNPGAGKSLSIDEFYIAKPGVTAAELNAQLADGKNIFFTPGEYVVDEPIHVVQHDQIVLGTGMATIIPENTDTAMRVEDENGIIIAGLIFDAGTKNSDTLLQVGAEGSSRNHQQNPTLLADLFFRIGGTTNEVTSAKTAVDINSNNVVCDHFWVWRADHGTGVAWGGNPATNGLVVDGDNVTAYGLFVEHFEEYDTLWRGEYGETYFYQNETAYDPINQDAYKSHDGTVNGYADYKVSNLVQNHYAVGLGIYNVFIYVGGTADTLGDATTASIRQENAVEVPNAEGVTIENVCTQTFAKSDGQYQSIDHIINGVGQEVSSGQTDDLIGEGWSRKFLLSYNNGEAKLGEVNPRTSVFTGTINTVTAEQPTNDTHVDDTDASTAAIEDAEPVYPVLEIAEKTLSGNAITFTAQRRVPVCYTVNKHGIILATKQLTEDQFVLGASGTKTGTAKTTGLLGTYSLTMTGVPAGKTLYARAYLIYTDSKGIEHTIYSDIDSMTNE